MPSGKPAPAKALDPAPAVAAAPARRFHTGYELGTAEAAEVMVGRYGYLIGVLGAHNVGKTSLLNALYLKASLADLADYWFAGSYSLQGFEDRVHLVRNWTGGQLPENLATHTTSTQRTAALLHLAVQQRASPEQRFDLLLTDLPGEWSRMLVERAEAAERFHFLRRADAVLVVVDGPLLAAAATRHAEAYQTEILLSRLATNVGIDRGVPLVLVVSKGDEINMQLPDPVERVRRHAAGLGFAPTVVLTASFSRNRQLVPSGTGINEVLGAALSGEPPPWQLPPPPLGGSERIFMRCGLAGSGESMDD